MRTKFYYIAYILNKAIRKLKYLKKKKRKLYKKISEKFDTI